MEDPVHVNVVVFAGIFFGGHEGDRDQSEQENRSFHVAAGKGAPRTRLSFRENSWLIEITRSILRRDEKGKASIATLRREKKRALVLLTVGAPNYIAERGGRWREWTNALAERFTSDFVEPYMANRVVVDRVDTGFQEKLPNKIRHLFLPSLRFIFSLKDSDGLPFSGLNLNLEMTGECTYVHAVLTITR